MNLRFILFLVFCSFESEKYRINNNFYQLHHSIECVLLTFIIIQFFRYYVFIFFSFTFIVWVFFLVLTKYTDNMVDDLGHQYINNVNYYDIIIDNIGMPLINHAFLADLSVYLSLFSFFLYLTTISDPLEQFNLFMIQHIIILFLRNITTTTTIKIKSPRGLKVIKSKIRGISMNGNVFDMTFSGHSSFKTLITLHLVFSSLSGL